jgi:hypothetical protein
MARVNASPKRAREEHERFLRRYQENKELIEALHTPPKARFASVSARAIADAPRTSVTNANKHMNDLSRRYWREQH